MAVETQSAQVQETLSVLRNASPVLPACCVCALIRDETEAPSRVERWVTQERYRQLHGVNPAHCLLSHTYCPECFLEFMNRMRAIQ